MNPDCISNPFETIKENLLQQMNDQTYNHYLKCILYSLVLRPDPYLLVIFFSVLFFLFSVCSQTGITVHLAWTVKSKAFLLSLVMDMLFSLV